MSGCQVIERILIVGKSCHLLIAQPDLHIFARSRSHLVGINELNPT
jgi:hypothetical protein